MAHRSSQWFPELTWESKERAKAYSPSQMIQKRFDATNYRWLKGPVARFLSQFGANDRQLTKTSSQIQSMDF